MAPKKPKHIPPPPDQTAPRLLGDVAAEVAKAEIGKLPVVGSVLQAFFGEVFAPLRARRIEDVVEQLRQSVNFLLRYGLTEEDLRSKPELHDIMWAAAEAGMRTHLEEKRQLYRNMIINSALPGAPAAVKQHLFLRLVEELTELHIQLAQFFASPDEWFKSRGREAPQHRGGTGMMFNPDTTERNLTKLLLAAMPDYSQEPSFLLLTVADLERRGLIQDQSGHSFRKDSWLLPTVSYLTRLGTEFLDFICDPKEHPGH